MHKNFFYVDKFDIVQFVNLGVTSYAVLKYLRTFIINRNKRPVDSNDIELVAKEILEVFAVVDSLAERITNLEASLSSPGVQNIIAGENITVDSTDPLNPIVASTA